MPLPNPETFVRRRPSKDTSAPSLVSEAGILWGGLDLCNGDVGRNVQQ